MNIVDLLLQMQDENASDLYLKMGIPPSMRINGTVVRLALSTVTDAWMNETLKILLTDHQFKIFSERPDLDFAYHLQTGTRYRINLFRQQGHIGLVARLIRDADLSFVNLHLPPTIKELAELPRGLVIVTGATGSGKSTTLASMISYIN
ncbi:MAG: type IV pili twitching motility protein PilT, partial [Candidatus Omnitrophota bacterium]